MAKQPPEIRILPDEVASRIAAGEVVERPASALKEMLENSIDAGAQRIEIDFAKGGKTYIKITDDGCGMTRQQALTSLEQHATSKIREASDIFNIASYGFRGEALPSIASISKFRMRTRPQSQQLGIQIDVDSGKVLNVRECGMPAGTELTVENIFCSVPARRKFLKSDNVEASHIIKLCRLYALALPNLRIALREDGKTVFESDCNLLLAERVRRIYGGELADCLIDFPTCERGGMKIGGMLLKPAESFATSRNIFFFINSRPVDCRAAFGALKDAYAQFLPKGRFAAAFLFFETNPRNVDINVHPAKREVRLKDEFGVREFIFDAVSNRLSEYINKCREENTFSKSVSDEAFANDFDAKKNPVIREIRTPIFCDDPVDLRLKDTHENAGNGFGESAPNFAPAQPRISPGITPENFGVKISDNKKTSGNAGAGGNFSMPSESESGASAAREYVPNWRFIGFFQKNYAIFETEKSLMLMSISAAIKRVDYTKIVEAANSGRSQAQTILMPIPLNFDRADFECFQANKSAFEACGFVLENFGKNFYRITAIPFWLDFSAAENFVKDFVEIARDETQSLRKRQFSTEHFARIAVRRLGVAGFDCTQENVLKLLSELLKCPSHLSSPDGKPTLREFSAAELARMFAR